MCGNSLVVQWLELRALNAKGQVQSWVRELRSHKRFSASGGGKKKKKVKKEKECMCVWGWENPSVKKPEFGAHLESRCLNSWNVSIQKCTSESKMAPDKRGFASQISWRNIFVVVGSTVLPLMLTDTKCEVCLVEKCYWWGGAGLRGLLRGTDDHLSVAQEDCTKTVIPYSSVLTYPAVHPKT